MISLLQNTGYLGIDIGTYAVKLAQVAKRGSRFCLQQSVVIPRQQPWHLQQDSPSLSSTEEIIAGRTLTDGFSGTLSASTMSMVLCDVRRLTVPRSNPPEIESAICSELEAVDRFQSSDRTFDYWPLAEQPGGLLDVNVLSTSTNWANQLALDQTMAGLRPQCIDGLPHALARACQLMHPDPQPMIALDWGFSRTTFCLVQNGQPLFVRMLRGCGFEQIMSRIAEEFAISLNEAQSVLRDTGICVEDSSKGSVNEINHRSLVLQPNHELQTAISGVIQSQLDAFAEELLRTVSFVQLQRELPKPERIVLSGGGATLANVSSWLESVIEFKTETWKLPQLQAQPESVELLGPAISMSALAFQPGGGR